MPTLLRIRGEDYRLDVTAAVNQSRALRRYRNRLARATVGGRPVGHATAQRFVEKLVLAVLSGAARGLEEGLSPRLDRVFRLREQLSDRYDRILQAFDPRAPRRPLDPELGPAQLLPLMQEMERAVDELEAHVSRREFQDALSHTHARSAEDVLHDAENLQGDLEARETLEPTLRLEDPEAAPPHDPEDPDPGRRAEEAYLQRYREQKRWAPPDPAVRAVVQRAADDLIARGLLPEGTVVGLVYTQAWSQGIEAQQLRFEALDPTFLGRGYEVAIMLPSGRRFRADGVHFTDARHYQFLESKEPYEWVGGDINWLDDPTVRPEGVAYSSSGGQAKLRQMLYRDAAIAEELRSNGCVGFRYETGHPKLDEFIAGEIARMRADRRAGADLLSAPGGGEP